MGQFLLLIENKKSQTKKLPEEGLVQDSSSRNGRVSFSVDALMVESCCSETERVIAKWSEWITERPQSLLPDMVRLVASTCIVNCLVVARQDERNAIRAEILRKLNETLIKSLTQFLARLECEQEKVDTVLDLIIDHLPPVNSLSAFKDEKSAVGGITSFALHLSKSLELRRNSRQTNSNPDDDDLDMDDGFDSQNSQDKKKDDRENAARDSIGVATGIFSFRSCVSAYTHLLSCTFQSTLESMAVDEDSGSVPSAFILRMTSLSASEFFACRPVLSLLLLGPINILAADADILLEHIAIEFMEAYDFDRHEVSQEITLDVLTGCASMWTDADAGDLHESASGIYDWFVTQGLAKQLCSVDVQLAISTLFFTLLEIQGPDYRPLASLPSVRTGLFELLIPGNIPVMYHISKRISQFFDHYTLGEHENVFDDLRKSMPEDWDWIEVTAIRLLFYARLGSAWQTLLRRCVFHIFEIAGLVELSLGHSSRCIASIADSKDLEEPRELFTIFAPQLIYTWLQKSQSLEQIPYSIFGYPSLRNLLEDVQDEVFAQAFMRSKTSDIDQLSDILTCPPAELLKINFGRTAAYSLAWDLETPNSQSEVKLKALLPKEWLQLLQNHFPTIIGIYIDATDSVKLIAKGLAKRPETAKAAESLKQMESISFSNTVLPSNQQPVFQPKRLMDRIDKLYRRTGFSNTWTPELYIFVLRMLLAKIIPALGSLHACSIVRKIRILVALGGDVAFSGYPLEMTLHALRPLLTDKQCAEDTLGVFQYLLSNGASYLATQISFVTGLMLSTLISLRKFVGSSQESTTQESQHRATMTKASTFHTWLVKTWSTDFTTRYGKVDGSLRAYTALVDSASQARLTGNAMEGSHESRVLRLILDDQKSNRNLLKGPTRDLAFGLLCSDFASPPSYRNDILGLDMQAARFAPEVWASCQITSVSPQYLLWAARVLGRAHNATADLTKLLRGRSVSSQNKEETTDKHLASKKMIMKTLAGLLFTRERQEVGIVEETLRSILLQTTSREELLETQGFLPPTVVVALSLMTTDVALRLAIPKQTLEHCLRTEDKSSFHQWIRDLSISLASSSGGDPLISSLRRVLHGVKGLAETLFPPILHLVLLRDFQGQRRIRQLLSDACHTLFTAVDTTTIPHVKTLLNAVLYLRKQVLPQETTKTDRLRWLDLDYAFAAQAAETCGMHTAALLFAETSASQQAAKSSRRSSSMHLQHSLPDELLLSIFKNIDEIDSFYGVQQNPSLAAVLDRLDYEADGFKGLLFRGARLDSQMRRLRNTEPQDARGLVRSLVNLNLNSVTHSLLSNQQAFNGGISMVDSVLHTARKLEQWDIRAPETANTEASTTFKVFQGISNATDLGAVRRRLDSGFLSTVQTMLSPMRTGQSVKSSLRTLGILAEVDDVMTSNSADTLRDAWKNMLSRQERMLSAQYVNSRYSPSLKQANQYRVEDIRPILSSRETMFSTLSNNGHLREVMHISLKDVRNVEVEALVSSCTISRQQNALQESLATATYLSDLVPICQQIGLDIETLALNEVADVLWDQGEQSTSIRMLRRLTERVHPKAEGNGIQQSKMLAKLVSHHLWNFRGG
jgi:ataxia telangiectasia mutated family protein